MKHARHMGYAGHTGHMGESGIARWDGGANRKATAAVALRTAWNLYPGMLVEENNNVSLDYLFAVSSAAKDAKENIPLLVALGVCCLVVANKRAHEKASRKAIGEAAGKVVGKADQDDTVGCPTVFRHTSEILRDCIVYATNNKVEKTHLEKTIRDTQAAIHEFVLHKNAAEAISRVTDFVESDRRRRTSRVLAETSLSHVSEIVSERLRQSR